MEKKFMSLVIYLHNTGSYLTYFLDQIISVCNANFEQYELVCVEDGCTDDTMAILREYVAEHQLQTVVNVIHMSFFQGLETAMNAGRDLAIGDFVYEFDDIFVDYDAEVIRKAYDKILEGNDIVAVSSKGKVRLTSRVFYSLYNRTSRGEGKIGPETFRVISRRAINRIKSMGQYIPYRKAVYQNCGLKKSILSYDSLDTSLRIKNKVVTNERTNLALDSFIYFTNVLERISAIISGGFLLITVCMGVYIALDYFNKTKPVEGWLSTMGFLALGFFGVFTLLTIILKYLSVLLNLVFKQQRYLIEDVEKIGSNS